MDERLGIFLISKFAKSGAREAICREISQNRVVIVTERKQDTALLFLYALVNNLKPKLYDLEGSLHIAFETAGEFNRFHREVPFLIFSDDTKSFVNDIEESDKLSLLVEDDGVFFLKEMEREEYSLVCQERAKDILKKEGQSDSLQ